MALKKSKKSDSSPNWHPDFRNPATLPDIKVVRTHFLLNFSSVAVAIILLFFYSHKEYSLQSINTDILNLEAEIEENKAENGKNTRLSVEFEKRAKKVNELDDYLQVPILPSDLILQLSENLPEEILLESITYSDVVLTGSSRIKYQTKSIMLSGTVVGLEEATQIVSEFSNELTVLPALEKFVDRIELSSLTRNEELGNFSYRMNIIFKEPK